MAENEKSKFFDELEDEKLNLNSEELANILEDMDEPYSSREKYVSDEPSNSDDFIYEEPEIQILKGKEEMEIPEFREPLTPDITDDFQPSADDVLPIVDDTQPAMDDEQPVRRSKSEESAQDMSFFDDEDEAITLSVNELDSILEDNAMPMKPSGQTKIMDELPVLEESMAFPDEPKIVEDLMPEPESEVPVLEEIPVPETADSSENLDEMIKSPLSIDELSAASEELPPIKESYSKLESLEEIPPIDIEIEPASKEEEFVERVSDIKEPELETKKADSFFEEIEDESLSLSTSELNNILEGSEIVEKDHKNGTTESSDMENVKKILGYLDTLFEKLPEDVIRDFAESEYYDLYNKVMDDLGL